MSRFDGKALELSRQAMKLFFEPMPGVQLQAKLQNLFISAMEYAAPVTAGTGWVKCSERMPKKGDRILIFIDFNSQAVPPSVHDAEYTGSTFRRGNATVKIYPHEDGFGVTHWMPLPAAPEQEV
ncbi:DUF551 domain-containing protein [Kosakonia sacchari]|uniref:DUF551 domain-containing protein n=1 Tax=Kosakonia sacchari TaxID=1158459 RepID=UPI0025B16F25|nr:DUF551 domain-containing protein [Kosakonia sacchari]MDN2486405.1 DUF551 domain-containing protein [Kosakonia sacchari]